MNKETVIKFYNNEPLSDPEIVEFLHDYLEEIEHRPHQSQELVGILTMVRQGVFQIHDAMERSANSLGYVVDKLTNKQGQVIKLILRELPNEHHKENQDTEIH